MTLLEDLHAERKARLVRLGATAPKREITKTAAPKKGVPPTKNIEPQYYHCMWFYNLVTGEVFSEKQPRPIRIEDIQTETAVYYRVRVFDLSAAIRTKKIVRPRQVAIFLSRKHTPASLPAIGRMFGGRDHSTMVHAVNKIAGLLDTDIELASDVSAIECALTQRTSA